MNMVITRVKNGSPDMIPTAFEGKFDEKKYMKYLPGCVDLICVKIFNIGDLRVDIKHKNGHKRTPRGSPWVRIWHVPYYHTVKDYFTPNGTQFQLN